MADSTQVKLQQKIRRYLYLRAMLVARGRLRVEIAEVEGDIARIREIMARAGEAPRGEYGRTGTHRAAAE